MKTTIGDQISHPEGYPDDFQRDLEQREALTKIGALPEVKRATMREVQKQWAELLGVDTSNTLVDGCCISRRIGPDNYRILWRFDTHSQALDAMDVWREQVQASRRTGTVAMVFMVVVSGHNYAGCVFDNAKSANAYALHMNTQKHLRDLRGAWIVVEVPMLNSWYDE